MYNSIKEEAFGHKSLSMKNPFTICSLILVSLHCIFVLSEWSEKRKEKKRALTVLAIMENLIYVWSRIIKVTDQVNLYSSINAKSLYLDYTGYHITLILCPEIKSH